MKSWLVLIFLLGLGLSPGHGQDGAEARWPQFRGPGGQGVAAEGMKLPRDFGPSKHVLWQQGLPHGHSSPCIWGDHIYVTGFDKKTQKLETLSLERRTGAILWRQQAPVEKLEQIHQLNSLATSTPATDGERVYVYFASFGLLCYDRMGKEVWQRPLPAIPSFFGSATSPVTAGELVLISVGGDRQNFFLLALDRKSGKTVWKQNRPRGFSTGLWSTPVVRDGKEGQEVLVVGGQQVVAYNLADGKERWQVNGLPTISLNTPAIGDGLAWFTLTNPIGEGDNVIKLPVFDEGLKLFDKDRDGKIAIAEVPENIMMFGRGRADKVGDWSPLRPRMKAFDRDRDGAIDRGEWQALLDSLSKTAASVQVAVYGIKLDGQGDVTKTHVAWKQTKAVPEVPSPLCYQGRVYLVSEKGVLTCRDPKSGKELYRERLNVQGVCYASPVAGDGKIYVASDGGTVVVLKAGDAFEVLATCQFDEAIFATPALVDGKIYLRTDRRLYAFGQ